MRLYEIERIRLGNNQGAKKKLDNYIEDYTMISEPHPWNQRIRIIDNTMIELYPVGDAMHVSDVQSMSPRQGFATSAVKKLQKLADKHGIKLELTAKAYANDPQRISDTQDLVRWYLRLGFDIDDDLIDDPDDLEGIEQADMVYYPK